MTGKFGRIDALKRDRSIEGEIGVDLKIDENIFLTVLAATDANTRWREGAPKVLRELRRLENAGAAREDVRARMARLYAETLVIGWRGVVDDKGNPVLFNTANCTDFLIEADDAYTAIERDCYDTQNFRQARADAIIANAKKESSGTASTAAT
jgi:hypothetical protein